MRLSNRVALFAILVSFILLIAASGLIKVPLETNFYIMLGDLFIKSLIGIVITLFIYNHFVPLSEGDSC